MGLVLEIFLLMFLMVVNRLGFVYVVNRKLHLTFIKNPVLTFLYFIVMTALMVLLFWPYASVLLHPGSILTVIFFLFMLVVVNPAIYHHLQKTGGIPKRLAALYPEQGILSINERYLFSKTGDVIFQQVSLGILLVMFYGLGTPFETLVPMFALLFAILHLHLFFSMRLAWAMYFTVCATASGFIVPFIILSVPGGVYFAIVFHMFWYVGSGAFFGSIERMELSVEKI